MEVVKNAENLKNLQYDIILKKRDRKFILFIRELGILEEDESLEKVYQKIEVEKNKYIQKMLEFGLQDEIIEPAKKGKIYHSFAKTSFSRDMALFLIKLGIVLIIALAGLKLATERVNSFITTKVEAVKNFSFSDFARDKANSMYHNLIDMPEGKVEKGRMKARLAVKKFKPIVDEFKVLFKDTNQGSLSGNQEE
jgi:hypothetical protein